MLALAACEAPAVAPDAAGKLPRQPAPDNAAALLHAGPAEVEAMLGAPDLRRKDGSAQVWLYAAAGDCRVDVVFYEDAGAPRVAHAVARVKPPGDEAGCLKRVASRPGS